jgi:hypothetical protein
VWRGGPVFLRDVWYWRHIIVHSVYHTENAVDVKVWRPPERLRFRSTARLFSIFENAVRIYLMFFSGLENGSLS